MNKQRLSLAAALVAVACSVLPGRALGAAGSLDGLWDAVVVAAGTEIPFRFEIASNGADVEGFFFEGDRKVGSSSGTLADGVLTLDFDHLNTTLEVKVTGDELIGTYRNKRAGSRPQDVRMRRFKPAPLGEEEIPQLAGNWEMRRNADEVTAPRDTRTWHVFLRQSGAELSGTILRVDGDTGTLVGRWQKGKLVLSHFAGERPNLFEATRNADGTLAVTLNGNAHYMVVRSSEARAKGIPEPPDPSRYTNVKDPSTPFAFAFPDLSGTVVSNDDARLRGKVIVLAIGGSWCPNCHDEAPFLTELYKDYRARGLEIVGLMFENDPDIKVTRPRVVSFIKRYGVQYPMLLAGTMQPSPTTKTIAEALPQLVNFGAYPTTIVLGRDGRVRNVHAGFPSAATGSEHTRHKREVRELLERLLAEPTS
ncbi:MAG TPA: TlpA disulfide reductase family protein [Vicinamibacterales bacterium]|jgi:thiol-disulfide isomerase/thioredoxin|nr:TlpA disulfide reductase family protein [Vicinamibacterales bacterium]